MSAQRWAGSVSLSNSYSTDAVNNKPSGLHQPLLIWFPGLPDIYAPSSDKNQKNNAQYQIIFISYKNENCRGNPRLCAEWNSFETHMLHGTRRRTLVISHLLNFIHRKNEVKLSRPIFYSYEKLNIFTALLTLIWNDFFFLNVEISSLTTTADVIGFR